MPKINNGSWFPWYPVQYRNDEKVQGLSWQARALWFELLNVLWTQKDCKLKINIAKISNLTKIPEDIIKEFWPEIMDPNDPLFESDDVYFWNKRLCKHRKKIETAYNAMVEGGKKGAAKRWGDGVPYRDPHKVPNGVSMLELDKEYTNNILSSSYSTIPSPIPSPNKKAQAYAQVENILDQVSEIGTYGSPKERDDITLKIMQKPAYSWRTVCDLSGNQIAAWKSKFVNAYISEASKG
ncbi:MAG: hypothetical protein JSW18_01695 [Candidatus Omnitrophota bacterium]|nr:MAG: hypothetical protein JSW18_01695 [Candidatus Omnitrophota bacterium]